MRKISKVAGAGQLGKPSTLPPSTFHPSWSATGFGWRVEGGGWKVFLASVSVQAFRGSTVIIDPVTGLPHRLEVHPAPVDAALPLYGDHACPGQDLYVFRDGHQGHVKGGGKVRDRCVPRAGQAGYDLPPDRVTEGAEDEIDGLEVRGQVDSGLNWTV